MRHLKKIYLEITNACNLSCPFCPPHARDIGAMSRSDFETIVARIAGKADALYFHLKGEPLLHPELSAFLDIARDARFPVRITTNGTLLDRAVESLSGKANLERLNISLHSLPHAGGQGPGGQSSSAQETEDALSRVLDAAERIYGANSAIQSRFLVSLRLWTKDRSADTALLARLLEKRFSLGEGAVLGSLARGNGLRLTRGFAIHAAETFEWPSLGAPDRGEAGYCHALRDQAGILVDGTVVPCCLDGDGVLALGNVLESDWDSILGSERAAAVWQAFGDRKIHEPLCRRCGYRTRFNANRI